MSKRNSIKQKGQALLLVLVGMSVVMVMALSVISRSITDISISTKDEDSLRAFSAAEAGVEDVIIGGSGEGDFEGSTFSASVSRYFAGDNVVYYPDELLSGQTATIWFVGHDANGNLACSDETCVPNNGISADPGFYVCFGSNATSEPPAVEISVYYDANYSTPPNVLSGNDYTGLKVVRYMYDSQSRGNSFAIANSGCSELTDYAFPYRTGDVFSDVRFTPGSCLDNPGCLLFAKVRMLYNTSDAQPVGAYITNGHNFASQGEQIDSVGQSNAATRKIEVIKTYEAPMSIFENGVYSVNPIIKNN